MTKNTLLVKYEQIRIPVSFQNRIGTASTSRVYKTFLEEKETMFFFQEIIARGFPLKLNENMNEIRLSCKKNILLVRSSFKKI